VDIHSPYRVSKYGVDIASLDRVGVSALNQAAKECNLVIVDEIGKMELFSANFREAVWQVISSGKKVLGTIMFQANPWADAIKRQPQVNLVEVTRANYHRVLEEILGWLEAD
jgi:nucleoside-triphosphatase